MSVLLEVKDVTKRFGGLCAITKCNVKVTEGSTHGIIGPNGAGKTTLFNLITGIYKPTTGRILFKDQNIAGLRPGKIATLGIGRTFQNIRLCKELSVLDNVRIAFDSQLGYNPLSGLLKLPHAEKAERHSIERCMELLGQFGLEDSANNLATELPYGLQRRLEIARAIALNPALLLLDEPAAGMNSGETLKLMEFLRWVRDYFKVTIVLIEHHMKLVMGLCDHITVLDFGVTIADGTPSEIHSDPRVIEAYLGEGEDE